MCSGVDTIRRPDAVVISIPSRRLDSWTRATGAARNTPLPKLESTSSPTDTCSIGRFDPSAMVTSVRAVVMSPAPMIGWAAVVVVLLIVSSIPYFLGLIVTLPVLGHATWHLYRRIAVPVPLP